MKTFLRPSFPWLLLLLANLPGVAPAAAPDLRYQFQAGSNHVYSLHLEADEPRQIATLDGLVTLQVKSANADAITLTARGALHNGYKAKEGAPRFRPSLGPGMGGMLRVGGFRFGAPPYIGGPFATPDEIEINAAGQVLRESGDTALPQALGALNRLLIEPLPPGGKATFEIDGNCTVILEEKVFVTSMSYRLKEVRMPAREKVVYTIGPADGDAVPLRKTYELKTTATVVGVPRFEMKGEGTNTFDVKRGLLRKLEFSATITEATENVTVRTPLKLICSLLEGEALVAAQKAAVAPPKPELKPLSADDRTSLLADLRSPDKARRTVALSRFGSAKADGDKSEVAAVLLPMLQDTDHFTRQNVAKALGLWGAADAVEPLLALLTDTQFNVRWAAIESLGALQDPRAAAPLARMIADKKETFQCSQALKVLGRAAEPEVLKLLADTRPEPRREACQILKTIGSPASLPALEKAASDGDQLVAMFAKQALKDVKERK